MLCNSRDNAKSKTNQKTLLIATARSVLAKIAKQDVDHTSHMHMCKGQCVKQAFFFFVTHTSCLALACIESHTVITLIGAETPDTDNRSPQWARESQWVWLGNLSAERCQRHCPLIPGSPLGSWHPLIKYTSAPSPLPWQPPSPGDSNHTGIERPRDAEVSAKAEMQDVYF